MPKRFTCPSGHTWSAAVDPLAADTIACPECGGAGETLPPADPLAATSPFLARDAMAGKAPARRSALRHAAASGDLSPSASLGRYRILELLGEGAMGAVWLAEDTELKRKVAIKVPKLDESSRDDGAARFLREARSAAALRHPNICPVYDIGQADGRPFIAMAFIHGKPLSHFIRPDNPIAPRTAARVIRKLALALHEAHAAGVVHRDLKPANVMIDAKGEPIVMDFGLAARPHDQESQRLTMHGHVLGTPAYMSPEQVEGGQEIGPATDIYSLGVILFELLTSSRPFRGEGLGALFVKIAREPAPAPSTLRPDVDEPLDAICLRMLAKTPAERFPSMAAAAEALGEFLRTKAAEGATASLGEAVAAARSLPPPLPPPLSSRGMEANTQGLGAGRTAVVPVDSAFVSAEIRNAPAPFPRRNHRHGWIYAAIASGMTLVLLLIVVIVVRQNSERGQATTAVEQRSPMYKAADAAPESQTTQPEWIELFNGRDLSGWSATSGHPANWKVQDGSIETQAGAGSIMTTRQLPLDFELHVEFWLPKTVGATGQKKANSGIYLLGRHEIQILDMFENPSVLPAQANGALYGAIAPRWRAPQRPESWQSFDITFHSPRRIENAMAPGRLTVVHDGVTIIDDESVPPAASLLSPNAEIGKPGPIVLQDHGSPVRFRNLRMRPIEDRGGFVSLYSARDLAGWRGDARHWTVANGTLVGRQSTGASLDYSYLHSARSYRDFELCLKAKLVSGNSGVQVRSSVVRAQSDDVFGPQVELTPKAANWGVVVTSPTKVPTMRAAVDRASAAVRPGEFNDLAIACRGKRLRVKINGITVNDGDFASMPSEGIVALQLNKNQPGMEVQFKDIFLRELPPSDDGGFAPLFPRGDLTAWQGHKSLWRIQNGDLVASRPSGNSTGTFLFSPRPYRDFKLTFEVRLAANTNSGVQIRSEIVDRALWKARGPHCDMGAIGQTNTWGGLWAEQMGAGWLLQPSRPPTVRPRDFNIYAIRCVGKHVSIRVNGETTVDGDVPSMADEGLIAFQIHGESTGAAEFRNVLIREL